MPKFQWFRFGKWAHRLLMAAALASLAQTASAQQTTPVSVQPAERVFQVLSPVSKIALLNQDTRVLELSNKIKSVEGFDPSKLNVTALSPHQIRLQGANPGVTSVKLIDEFDGVYTIDVFVRPDTRELQAYLEEFFPGAAIQVTGVRDSAVLRGWVTEPAQIPEIIAVAEQFYPAVQNQLKVGGVSQVQLHVKVMEIQRSKLRELGFNFLLLGQDYYVSNAIGGLAPLQNVTIPFGGPPAVTINPASLGGSEISFAIAGNDNIFQGFLKALQTEAMAKILAEPVLVTTSGRPATLHSGGEFPILVPQSFGNLSIEWREFGVQMQAVPVVLGNGRVRLDLSPEVSERDFSNSVQVNGLVVPGITSRSVNTQVELRFGETLMIGGLISNRRLITTQKVPFLGELPWIGAAFSRKQHTMAETELIILVTPQMASPMLPGQVPCGGPGQNSSDPTDHELYLDGLLEVPNFGPECPDCEPQMILPPGTGNPLPAHPGVPTPVPPMPNGVPPAILQTSAEKPARQNRSVLVNPFRAASASREQDTSNTQSAPTTPRPSSPGSDPLPGLIPPTAKATPGS